MSQAPDFVRPALGFRSWVVDQHGVLRPISAVGTWTPGVNHAECHRGLRHRAPAADCECGLYALHEFGDRTWAPPGPDVVHGAVIGWGDVEVHETGFRAEFARVVALAEPSHVLGARALTLAERSARLYGVELVSHSHLLAEGRRWGEPLPADLRPRRRAPAADTLHVDPRHHVWALKQQDGRVRVGVTAAMREVLSFSPELLGARPVASSVERGEEIVTVSGLRGDVAVRSPVSGVLSELNPALDYAPQTLRRAPFASGWVALVEPSSFADDVSGLLSGAALLTTYLQGLRDEDDRRAAFAEVVRERPLGWRPFAT